MATAVAVLGTVVGGVMSYSQSMYQARVARQNAAIARENANRAYNKAQIDVEDKDRQTAGFIADQESMQAASGLSISGGSQLQTRRSARNLSRLDSLRLIDAGLEQRHNHLIEEMNFKSEAKAKKFEAYSGLVGTAFQAAGTALNSTTQSFDSLLGKSSTVKSVGKYVPRPISKPINLMKRKRYEDF